MKFDVVLSNPPFGEDRAYIPETVFDEDVIKMYETWDMASGEGIDLGIVFLENAVKILKEGGRMGIVLSNSIASIKKWESVRKWLMERMRIVALFDLPPNVFGETGVATN
jgi:type I restriction enzyme M protein